VPAASDDELFRRQSGCGSLRTNPARRSACRSHRLTA